MSTMDPTVIGKAFALVRERIARAAESMGHDSADVTVVAVTKRHPPGLIDAAHAAGIRHVGENYVQELTGKLESVQHASDLQWHFIGHLQRNKVKSVVGRVVLIHAVDSVRLAEEIEKHAARMASVGVLSNGVQQVLVAVNIAGEEQKSGVPAAEARELVKTIEKLPHVRCTGLMTMPPLGGEPGANRPYFRELAALRDTLATSANPLRHLSMGTSGDFEDAVAEGATLVRVGSTIFGRRPT